MVIEVFSIKNGVNEDLLLWIITEKQVTLFDIDSVKFSSGEK